MDNSVMKSNLRQFDFTSQTPLRTNNNINNPGDLYSSQKLKYENSYRPVAASIPNIANPIMNSEAYLNQKEIYENQIKVRVKGHEREDYQTILNIKLGMMVNASPSHTQILHIEITDETNHLFLYTMDLSETDFLNLKNEQSILVDFQQFPSKLIEMFDLCLSSLGADERLSFLCVLNIRNTGEAFFNIVETNQFKALTHLSLKFREANDQTLKQYLARRLMNERMMNEDLRIKIERLEDNLNMRNNELEAIHDEFKRLQVEKDQKIEEIRNTEGRRMNEIQRSALENEANLKNEFDQEKKSLISQYEKKIRELVEKLEGMTTTNTDLLNNKIELESKQRELSGILRAYEKENAALQVEIERIRLENSELSNTRFSNEKELAHLRASIENLETQIKNKDEIIKRSSDLLETTNAQKATLEENIAGYKKQIEKLEHKCNICSEEINKGNEIIEKLQNDLAVQKQKMKTKNSLVLQQEQAINEYQGKIETITKNLNESQRENDQKQFRIKELETTIEDLKNKLTESQKAIETSNSMIQWLNKSLNETQKPMGPRISATTSKYAPVSPFKQYPEENPNTGTSSYKYSNTVNMDKYNKYQAGDYSPGFTGADRNTFGVSKTMATQPFNSYLQKPEDNDFDRGFGSNLNKENFDSTNRPMDYRNRTTSKSLYTTTPTKELGSTNFGGYTRPIQPIRYEAPNK